MCFICYADQPEFAERHHMDQVERFTEAVALGQIADEEFALACIKFRLSRLDAILAPLDCIAMASAPQQSDAAH